VLALAPARRAEMGSAGRAWVAEHASVSKETAKLVRLIRDVAVARD
jgi:hypothetical protein